IDGFYDFLANPTKANKVKFYKRMFNLAVLNGVAIAIVNSLAHGFDWEDEDEDGILIDDIGRWAQFDMINSAFGNFYFGGEIARKVTSTFDDAPWRYEIQNPLEMVVNDGMEAMINIVRVGKTDKRTGEYNFTIDDGLVDMFDVTTKMVGVPNKLIKYPEQSYDYFFGEE
ncbi:MAG: hypothetical protein KAJ19_20825, partial [Gammaproteobacteria bacterium]|nr:hypothetical protein [Gammaproteobacteria bacterium]